MRVRCLVLWIVTIFLDAESNFRQLYASQNRVKEAIEALQKAIELKPKLASARFNLGVIFVATGKKDQALEQQVALQSLDKDLAKKLKEMIEGK